MPISHRKGIEAKAAERERVRRSEAAESGVVLERAKGKVKGGGGGRVGGRVATRRDRGVGGPSVGTFHGGTLRLSARDVRSIQGARGDGVTGRRGRR